MKAYVIMRSLFLIALLCLMQNPAAADWVKLSETKRGKRFFIEQSEVVVEGDRRTVVELIDNKRPDRDGDRSIRVLREYDCTGTRYKVINATYFKEPMGSGEPSMSVEGTMGWTPIDPETPARAILDHVCAIK